MTPKEFKKFQLRDKHCPHCGATGEMLVPHHRKNRGMGGSPKIAKLPSNILSVCAEINGLMESDSEWAEKARTYGWKLSSWQDPQVVPVYDAITTFWFRLDNNYQRKAI